MVRLQKYVHLSVHHAYVGLDVLLVAALMLPPSVWSLPRLSANRGFLLPVRSLGRLLLYRSAKLNRRPESPSPWRRPLVVAKGPESFSSTFTWQVSLVIVILTNLISLAGIPKELIALYSFTLAMLSYVALKYMKRWYVSCLYSAIFSKICRMVKIRSVVNFPFRNPF